MNRFRTSSTLPATAGSLQPRPGVYLYRGAGTESLSFMHTRQTQGPVEPATVVTRPNGCWSFEIDFNSFHSQTWTRCSDAGRLEESGGTATQEFDFVAFKESEHSVTTCAPPIVEIDPRSSPGATGPVRCRVVSSTTKTTAEQNGTFTFVGRETVDVGGVAVPAIHGRQAVTLSGGQTGTVLLDIWFAADNTLPLREQHLITVVSTAPAPINHVTYTEQGQWQLTSLVPKT